MTTVAATALAGSAYAADLPSRRAPPPAYIPPVPIFTWTGFYIGANAGGAFRTNNNLYNNTLFFGGAAPVFGFNNGSNNGRFIGGGQAGVNYQVGQFVFGVEGDGQALVGGRPTFPGGVGGGSTSFLGTVRGRGGLAFDRLIVYGTGGVAFGNSNLPTTAVATVAGIPGFFTTANGNNMRVGYAVGAGLEYAFAPNWSVKAEYLFTDLGRNKVPTCLAPARASPSRDASRTTSCAPASTITSTGSAGPPARSSPATDSSDQQRKPGLTPGFFVFGRTVQFAAKCPFCGQTVASAGLRQQRFLGTVRGRGGIAFDRFLVYGTGGVAFGTGPTINTFNPFLIGAGPFFNNLNNNSNWRVGYAVGGGVEYAFLNNWSVKLEYLFTDLGRTNNNNGFFFNNNNFRERNHIVRAGLNYKFDWFGAPAPVVARY